MQLRPLMLGAEHLLSRRTHALLSTNWQPMALKTNHMCSSGMPLARPAQGAPSSQARSPVQHASTTHDALHCLAATLVPTNTTPQAHKLVADAAALHFHHVRTGQVHAPHNNKDCVQGPCIYCGTSYLSSTSHSRHPRSPGHKLLRHQCCCVPAQEALQLAPHLWWVGLHAAHQLQRR
jgi:hypothetical protein